MTEATKSSNHNLAAILHAAEAYRHSVNLDHDKENIVVLADEIERLRAALAGEAGLVELVASRPHFTETDRLTILGNHRHLDALAMLDADEICREHVWCALDKGHPGLCNSNRYGVADETTECQRCEAPAGSPHAENCPDAIRNPDYP